MARNALTSMELRMAESVHLRPPLRGIVGPAAAWLFALFVLPSCSSVDTSRDIASEMYQDVDKKAAEPPTAVVPDYVNQALLMNKARRERSSARTHRFDVTVNDMPAKAFFVSLVSEAGVNVVAHPEVEGSITLQLKNVTVQEVLDVARDVYGYEYRLNNRIYTIYPRKLRTEIFPINYIDVKRVGVSDTSVSIGEIRSSGGQSGGGAAVAAAGSPNIISMLRDDALNDQAQQTTVGPGSRVQTLNKTDFWQMVERSIGSIIGLGEDGRSLMVNPQAGLVVVTAMPAELGKVREFLVASELSVKRQVVLEAQILEVRLHKGFEAGVNWNAISGALASGYNLADGFPLNTDGSAAVDPYRTLSRTEIITQPDGRVETLQFPVRENMGSTVAGLLQVKDITKLLSLLETQGKVQVLSSPRVSTVNNQKAVIRVGEDEFFVTGLSNSTTASAGATTTAPEVELASFFSGISLDVTPQISDDGDVLLHIHPIISEVTDQQKELIVGDARISLPLALREIRESDSIVRARSGEVVVLGGLMQESVRRTDGKRPGLGDIPGLSMLFKTKSEGMSKTELVILLRPVVVDHRTWQQQLSDFDEFSQSIGDYP